MTAPRTVVPPRILARVRKICLALPDVVEERAWVGVRWTIRKRNFAHVVKIEDGWPLAYARAAGTDGPLVILTFRAQGMLHDTLRTAGLPFFAAEWGTLWGAKVIGMAIDAKTDWSEVAVLVKESYHLLAPARH